MRATDFDFELPPERIAQVPAPRRDAARLYVLPRAGGPTAHATVADLPQLVPDGALLVVNDTRVMPARLWGRKPSGGRVQLLLLHGAAATIVATDVATERGGRWTERWRCMAGASKPIRPGQILALDGDRPPACEVVAVHGKEVDVDFSGEEVGGLAAALERIGEVPLPPYIERGAPPDAGDRARYQTVYARHPGAAAAPTAGLHFTDELLAALATRGVTRAALTLHVGLGTFAPLASDDVDSIAELHAERYSIPAETAAAVAAARAAGRPVIAVGTTSVRALESAALIGNGAGDGTVVAGPGEARLFIRPGFRFRAVDALLTNFHLPRSTLLMLVSAFAGRERVLAAYADAVARGYRFFSYGDAMLIS